MGSLRHGEQLLKRHLTRLVWIVVLVLILVAYIIAVMQADFG